MNRFLSRLAFLFLMSLAALDLAAQAPPTPDTESWSVQLDPASWQLGRQEGDAQHVLREYFPPGQTAKDWQEKVTSYFDARKAQPKWLVGWIKEDLVPNCAAATVEILEESEETVLIEVRHQGCQDFVPLHEVRRITAVANGTLTLSYGGKVKELPAEKRNAWVAALREAAPAGAASQGR